MIRPVALTDAEQICAIYNYYVENTVVTFEEKPVSPSEMSQRIKKVTSSLPWLVSELDGQVCGYAYATHYRTRAAYKFTVESSLYLAPDRIGQGLGTELLSALLDELRERKLHCVIAGISLPNPASVALSEKFGFRKVAELIEVGWKQDRWVDVGYWELII